MGNRKPPAVFETKLVDSIQPEWLILQLAQRGMVERYDHLLVHHREVPRKTYLCWHFPGHCRPSSCRVFSASSLPQEVAWTLRGRRNDGGRYGSILYTSSRMIGGGGNRLRTDSLAFCGIRFIDSSIEDTMRAIPRYIFRVLLCPVSWKAVLSRD